jgi:DNA-binding transcriptional regulator YiaG
MPRTKNIAPRSTGEALAVLRGRRFVASGELQRVREQLGLSKAELARLLHVWPANVNHWERHKKVPDADHAVAIAQVVDEMRALADELALTSDSPS